MVWSTANQSFRKCKFLWLPSSVIQVTDMKALLWSFLIRIIELTRLFYQTISVGAKHVNQNKSWWKMRSNLKKEMQSCLPVLWFQKTLFFILYFLYTFKGALGIRSKMSFSIRMIIMPLDQKSIQLEIMSKYISNMSFCNGKYSKAIEHYLVQRKWRHSMGIYMGTGPCQCNKCCCGVESHYFKTRRGLDIHLP